MPSHLVPLPAREQPRRPRSAHSGFPTLTPIPTSSSAVWASATLAGRSRGRFLHQPRPLRLVATPPPRVEPLLLGSRDYLKRMRQAELASWVAAPGAAKSPRESARALAQLSCRISEPDPLERAVFIGIAGTALAGTGWALMSAAFYTEAWPRVAEAVARMLGAS